MKKSSPESAENRTGAAFLIAVYLSCLITSLRNAMFQLF